MAAQEDGYTILNLGTGGNVMDETAVEYGCEPFQRLRSRVVVSGGMPDELAPVINTVPAADDYGLVVRNIPSGQQFVLVGPQDGVPTAIFDEVTGIMDNNESTVTSYTVPVGKKFQVTGFSASGNVDGIYRLYLNGDIYLMGYSSVAVPTISLNFQNVIVELQEGEIGLVSAFHSNTGISASFNATLIGYLV